MSLSQEGGHDLNGSNPPPEQKKVDVSEESKEARRKMLLSDRVVRTNLEADEAVQRGEVYYGGTK